MASGSPPPLTPQQWRAFEARLFQSLSRIEARIASPAAADERWSGGPGTPRYDSESSGKDSRVPRTSGVRLSKQSSREEEDDVVGSEGPLQVPDSIVSKMGRVQALPGKKAQSNPAAPENAHTDHKSLGQASAQPRVMFSDEPDQEVGRVNSVLSMSMAMQRIDTSQELTTSDVKHSSTDGGKVEPQASFVARTLPLNWPMSVQMRHQVNVDATRTHRASISLHSKSPVSYRTSDPFSDDGSTEPPPKRCSIDPQSKIFLTYSVACLLFVLYDMTVLPVILAWGLEFQGAIAMGSLLTACFWSFDVVVNFFVGFYDEGALVLEMQACVKHYLKTRFLPDFVVAMCDWTGIIVASTTDRGSDAERYGKLARLFRLVSMLRFLRLVQVIDDLEERYLSEAQLVLTKLIHLLVFIVWVGHLLSCLWYAIGTVGISDTGARWTEAAQVYINHEEVAFADTSMQYQYMTSFAWATGQITLGGIDVFPKNSLERFVFVGAMMIGFFFGSALISTLSAALTEYRMNQKDKTQKLRQLRRYLWENKVQSRLAVTVTKQAEQRVWQVTPLEEQDVQALGLLSASLRLTLRFELQARTLVNHAMFRLFISIDEGIMQQVCNESVSSRCLMPKDDLFISGTHALDAFFLDEGKLNYLQDPDTSPVEELSSRRVVPGSAMIAEAALWSQWIHVGTAESLVCSKVHTIHADNLVNALQPHAHLMKIAAEYAQQFHKRVVSAKPPHVPWPNDLEVPYTDYCNLVVSMSQGVQVTIGMDAWWHFAEAHHHLLMGGFGSAISRTVSSEARAADKLRQEIESGRSLVVVTGSGSIIRVASIVLLKVTNEEGKILAQVGSTSQDESNDLWKQVKAECQLPGAKQDRDELVSDTITRICRTRLDKDPETLMIREVLSETTESQSKGYGVQTRYLRQIARAEIHSNNLVPGMSVTRSSVTSMELKDAFNSSTSMDKSASRRFSKHSGGSSSSTATYGFMDTDIFVVEYQDRRFLYAWMEQEDFDFLQKPGAENLLRAWIGEVASNDWQPAAPGSHMGSYPLDDSLGPSTMFATAPAADQMGEMAPAMSSSAADAT